MRNCHQEEEEQGDDDGDADDEAELLKGGRRLDLKRGEFALAESSRNHHAQCKVALNKKVSRIKHKRSTTLSMTASQSSKSECIVSCS